MDFAIKQVNAFYNYTVGTNVIEVDLVETALNLLKSNIAKEICFSDLKCFYVSASGSIEVEWIRPKGRRWDTGWEIELNKNIPEYSQHAIISFIEQSFAEKNFMGPENIHIPPFFRASLPPVVLEAQDFELPIYPYVTMYSDGVFIISFQCDTEWDCGTECPWEAYVVNLFKTYFDTIWINKDIQIIDGERQINEAFEDHATIAGQPIHNKIISKTIKNMRKESRELLYGSLNSSGKSFNLSGSEWVLHKVAGTERIDEWESTVDLCRSVYFSAILENIKGKKKAEFSPDVVLWQGRPSISVMRFDSQPCTKQELLLNFREAISKILMRSNFIAEVPSLPPDLRPHLDYALHGNRSILLWTWLRRKDAPDDVWSDSNTLPTIFDNQTRACHFEYHNMQISRACELAKNPFSKEQVMYAYKTLTQSNDIVHKSSQMGEVVDALEYLLSAAGTKDLVPMGKDFAEWRLEEYRHISQEKKGNIDRLLVVLFGLVGAASLSDLVAKPFVINQYPDMHDGFSGLVAFLMVSILMATMSFAFWLINKRF